MLTKPADHDPTPSGSGETMSASIFVSYASSDRNQVDRLVTFLEAHHFTCWVSYRDVGVGENYQESITRAVRAAKVLIVVFTRNANSSSEIQKELSLASRYKLLVIPLRIEDVEPGDALAYELATHQWVDMFRNWSAGCERLLSQLGGILSAEAAAATKPRPLSPELAAAIAGRPAAPSGPVFVAPRRMPANPSTAVAAMPAASVAAAAAPALPAGNSIEPDYAIPRRKTRFMGAMQFIVVAVTFGLLLASSLRQGEPSVLQLIFWEILLIGCVRLFGAIDRKSVV